MPGQDIRWAGKGTPSRLVVGPGLSGMPILMDVSSSFHMSSLPLRARG